MYRSDVSASFFSSYLFLLSTISQGTHNLPRFCIVCGDRTCVLCKLFSHIPPPLGIFCLSVIEITNMYMQNQSDWIRPDDHACSYPRLTLHIDFHLDLVFTMVHSCTFHPAGATKGKGGATGFIFKIKIPK